MESKKKKTQKEKTLQRLWCKLVNAVDRSLEKGKPDTVIKLTIVIFEVVIIIVKLCSDVAKFIKDILSG